MSWLGRRWFLLLLAAGLGLAVLRPDWLRPASERLPLRVVVALSLFSMAWSLEGRRLGLALARPAGALYGVLISFVFLPGLALLLGALLPAVDLRLGLLLIASVPCTLSSAVLWTRHAGGDDALALVVVVLTTGLAWLLTPLWLSRAGPVAVALDPGGMMRLLALVLLVPVAAGQAVRWLPGVPAFVARHRTANGIFARLLVASVVVAATVSAVDRAGRTSEGEVLAAGLACVALHVAGLLLGLVGGRSVGLGREDRIAVAFAGSQKTLPVGLLLFGAYYREEYPLAVLPLLLYHAGQLLIDTWVADRLTAAQQPSPPR